MKLIYKKSWYSVLLISRLKEEFEITKNERQIDVENAKKYAEI